MFTVSVNKTKLSLIEKDIVTSGSVNAFCVCFQFSEEWDNLEKTALFRVGTETKAVPLDENSHAIIPKEILMEHSKALYVSVYGKGTMNHNHFPPEEEEPPATNPDEPENPGGTVEGGDGIIPPDTPVDTVDVFTMERQEEAGGGEGTDNPPTVEPTPDESTEEQDDQIILPSIWISLGTIREGITQKDLDIGNENGNEVVE